MCGRDDREDVADFGMVEQVWYQQHGVLLSGPPSHDTLRRVFNIPLFNLSHGAFTEAV